MLTEFIEQERSVGQLDSPGEFTVSLEDASRKLSRYQANERLFCVLKLVQAAVAGGATEIRFFSRRRSLRMVATGVSGLDLSLLAARLVQSRLELGDTPEGHLAAALLGHAKAFECRLDAHVLVGEKLSEGSGEPGELTVVLSGSVAVSGLEARVCYAPLPVYLDGRCLNFNPEVEYMGLLAADSSTPTAELVSWAGPFQSQGPRAAGGHQTFPLTYATGVFQRQVRPVPMVRAVLRFLSPQATSTVVLVKHGVTLQRRPNLKIPGTSCVVSAEGLPMDVSTLRPIEGPEFAALLERLEGDVRTFYRDLVDTLPRNPAPDAGRAVWVALGVVVMVVAVIAMVCSGAGEGLAACGSCDGGSGCTWGSSTPKATLRDHLMTILAADQVGGEGGPGSP